MVRRVRTRGRTLLSATLGLALLAVPAFAFGLLAGVAWEDPGLLALHLLGGTEEVALAPPPPSAAEPEPDVAAAPPDPRGATRLRPEVIAPGAAAEAVEAPAAPPAARFAVQVGAFADAAAAKRLAEDLRGSGFPVYVTSTAGRWRVRVGPLASREAAERTAERLKRDEKLPTWVLDEGAA